MANGGGRSCEDCPVGNRLTGSGRGGRVLDVRATLASFLEHRCPVVSQDLRHGAFLCGLDGPSGLVGAPGR